MKSTSKATKLSLRTSPTIWDIRSSLWALRTRKDGSAFSALLRGATGFHLQADTNRNHLEATMKWLCSAQAATPDDGVSAFYDLRSGSWGPSYPETTGYIIPTFYDYANYSGDNYYKDLAQKMSNWLLTLQLESGAFPIGPIWEEWERKPIVFDTGQIIFGLVRAFKETGNLKFLDAARRSGDWLTNIQENDGSWEKHTSLELVHAYNVRVAWSLLVLYEACQDTKYRDTATKNIAWVLLQQGQDGWFEFMNFKPGEDPLTHTIAYTIRGILKSSIILEDQKMLNAAQLAADKLKEQQISQGYLQARYSAGWQSNHKWICPTGTAQIAIVWLRLFENSGEIDYLEAATTAIQHLKQIHPLSSKNSAVAGGLYGSYPIYEEYEPYRHLNWAAKFFADSLLILERLKQGR